MRLASRTTVAVDAAWARSAVSACRAFHSVRKQQDHDEDGDAFDRLTHDERQRRGDHEEADDDALELSHEDRERRSSVDDGELVGTVLFQPARRLGALEPVIGARVEPLPHLIDRKRVPASACGGRMSPLRFVIGHFG